GSGVDETVIDREATVGIEVYEGEQEDVRLNTFVGEVTVEGLAPVPAGNEVMVHMNLTLDGILQVTATEKRTGRQRQVRIENALARFQREEREGALRRLDELFGVPSGTSPGRAAAAPGEPAQPQEPDAAALQRLLVQARALLEKAERMLPGVAQGERAELELLMARLRDAMAARREADVETQSDELADLLYYLEDR